MNKVEININRQRSASNLQKILRAWALEQNAKERRMGRLVRRYKTKGESMHWHIGGLRKGMGTVEVTYLPSSGRLTVLVHDNRRGSWAGNAHKELARHLRKVKP